MEDKVVVITGADNGIGLHMTESLLEDGYRVAGFDLSGERLSVLAGTYPDRLCFYRCDVADADRVEEAVEDVLGSWGEIDILVNNACRAVFAPFEQRDLEETRGEFDVNYFGYCHTMRAVLPHMKARGRGIIHNVSSSVGLTGFPGISGYASTKGAIEALTRTVAMEVEPYGVTVNLMHPPLTNTRSAAPLGIPVQGMANPAVVGRKLASKIESTRPTITPDLQTAVGLFATQHFPRLMGRLMAKMAEKAQ